MTASLTWVNHASYILATGRVHMIVDPWLYGDAFNHGWDLLSPSTFQVADFQGITHIWFSHEHPDHFAPAVLSAIPEPVRRGIQVLYQESPDGRVASFCRKLGFEVRELRDREWVELGSGLRIMCGRVPFYDSWLLAEFEGLRVLNMNDCEPPTDADVRRIARFTGKVDVLLTQFSFANRVGDVQDTDKRRQAAREKLDRVACQIRAFEPRHTVLCASFVFFSHEENDYLNDAMNTPEAALDFVREETDCEPLVFYPGDVWDLRSSVDCSRAIESYREDLELEGRPRHRAEQVALDTLRELAAAYVERMRTGNNRFLIWLATRPFLPLLPTVEIFLTDLEIMIRFDPQRGLQDVETEKADADVWTSSENIAFALRHDFGGDTLYVNGRFSCPNGNPDKLLRCFALGTINNTGRRFSFGLLFDRSFVHRARRVLFKRPHYMR